jgi:hypothetical protein
MAKIEVENGAGRAPVPMLPRQRQGRGPIKTKERIWSSVKRSVQLHRETDALKLHTILHEHDRGDTLETMLMLAHTIKELRGNLARLQSVLDGVLSGEGRIGLMPYGPHRQDALKQTIRAAKKSSG